MADTSDANDDPLEKSEGTLKKDKYIRTRGRLMKLPHCCIPVTSQPTFYLSGYNGASLVEGPLLALGWKRTTDKLDEKYKLKWTESQSSVNFTTFREGEQMINHIPNCKLLTNKLGLLCSLQEYERVSLIINGRYPRLKMADFVPETYKLDQRQDRLAFLNVYKDGETWICKPVGMNQGKGIILLRSRDEINRLLNDRDSRMNNSTSSRAPMLRIVQRYIASPLLLEGRKFDIRTYMLIASTVPFLVLYHRGYVRLSCQKYNGEDRNLTIHLTNQYVQKKDPTYEDKKEDTVWTMNKLNQYVNEQVAGEKQLETDWVHKTLAKQMQRIALHCFNSVKHKLHRKTGYFDLYGMDFMVDSNMKVWLIEINSNPALQTNCQGLKEAIPCVVEHALYLAIECFEKCRKRQPLLPLQSLGGYRILYCGSSQQTAAPRQSRSLSPIKDNSDYNRQSATGRNWSPLRSQRRSMTQIGIILPNPSGPTTLVSVRSNDKVLSSGSSLPIINIGSINPVAESTVGNENVTPSSTQKHHPQQQAHHQHIHLLPAASPTVTSISEENSAQFNEAYAEESETKPASNSHRGN